MNLNILGIHHITLIASQKDELISFYSDLLGLKLIKETVNFDSPDIPHLYFGNNESEPGSVLTFFVYAGAPAGVKGGNEVSRITLAIPEELFAEVKAKIVNSKYQSESYLDSVGKEVLKIVGPDGVGIELIPTLTDLYMIYSVKLNVRNLSQSQAMIESMGAIKTEVQSEGSTRYFFPEGNDYNYLEYVDGSTLGSGNMGSGTVHHLALEVSTVKEERDVRNFLNSVSIQTTEVIDRKYFKSIYFNEPSGLLFEIATTEPGFDLEETNEPEVKVEELEGFKYKFFAGHSSRTLVLFHGTGGDEDSLLEFARRIDPKAKILAIRGTVNENGMLRFFQRYENGVFNEEDIKNKSTLLKSFIKSAAAKHEFEMNRAILLGYSNGANMAASILLLNPEGLGNAILLRPTMPLSDAALTNSSFTPLERKVLIVNGMSDIENNSKAVDLSRRLTAGGADVDNREALGGHEITIMDEELVKSWYEDTYK